MREEMNVDFQAECVTVAFVIYYDEERYLEECIYYIEKLQIPLGVKADIHKIKGKADIQECYREAEAVCHAEYKIFLDQHVLIVHDLFLYDMLSEFMKNSQLDALGILGGEGTEDIGCGRVLLWDEEGLAEINRQEKGVLERVNEINHMLIAFRTPSGRETEGIYAFGAIPWQERNWCIYDCGNPELSAEGENYRFMIRRAETCRSIEAVEAVEQLLKSGKLTWQEHIAFAEKNALGNGSMAAYYWEDSLLIDRKRGKYLKADGRVRLWDRARNEMHIVVSFNHKYAVYAAVMLQSLYENHPFCRIHVHVLQNELTAGDKAGLKRQAEEWGNVILFYDIDRQLLPEDIPITDEWSAEAYFRLLMLDVLPKDIERVLYLDVDMIVNKPVYDLYFMDMKGYEIVGCRDFSLVLKEEFGDKRKELFADVKDDENFVYINSGMLLINLPLLREHVGTADYLRVIREQKGKLLAPDQDVINLVHWRKTGLVDEYRYDFFQACLKDVSVEEVKQYVSIIHYAGPKPWMTDDIDAHAYKIWWEYAIKTAMAEKLVYETVLAEKRLIAGQKKVIEKMKYCGHVPFMSCEVDGIKYIGSSQDFIIMRNMYHTGENWAKAEIDTFFQLTKLFYGYGEDEVEGIFLEVGGNIGTTSIYVNKVKAPQLKVIAFEPVRDNIRVFKANCALNDILPDQVKIVEKAVSNERKTNVMKKNVFNPGMSCIVSEEALGDVNIEEVESISLDDYLAMERIEKSSIQYLWLDAEGYEGYVIDGAKEMLTGTGIPVMTEFVPQYLKRQNCYELLINNLSELYTYFIWVEEYGNGMPRLRKTDTLFEFGQELGERQADIFLVKK